MTGPIIEQAQSTGDEEWLEQCLSNLPVKLRAKMMDAAPEQMGLDLDWAVAGEVAWGSCHQVTNLAIAQNNPRLEAADV